MVNILCTSINLKKNTMGAVIISTQMLKFVSDHLNLNLGGLFRSSFWGDGGRGLPAPPPIHLVENLLEVC